MSLQKSELADVDARVEVGELPARPLGVTLTVVEGRILQQIGLGS